MNIATMKKINDTTLQLCNLATWQTLNFEALQFGRLATFLQIFATLKLDDFAAV